MVMREEADMRREARGLVMVALIAHYHEPSSWKSIVLNLIPALYLLRISYCRLPSFLI